MTDIVIPSTGRRYNTKIEALLPRYNGGNWIIPSARSPFPYPRTLEDGNLSEFEFIEGDNGQTLTVGPGEAVVGGRWLARDTETTLSFTSAELDDGPTVYLTFSQSAPDTVIIDSLANIISNPDAPATEDNLCYICEYQGVAGWGRQEGRKTPIMTEQYPRDHGSRHDLINGTDKIPNLAGGQCFVHTAKGSTTLDPNTTEEVTIDYDVQSPIVSGKPRVVASLNTAGVAGDVFVTPTSPGVQDVTLELKNTTDQNQSIEYSVIMTFDLSENDIY